MQTGTTPAIKIEVRDPDHEALLAIQELLDRTKWWSSETTSAIARIMTDAGYRIRDLED